MIPKLSLPPNDDRIDDGSICEQASYIQHVHNRPQRTQKQSQCRTNYIFDPASNSQGIATYEGGHDVCADHISDHIRVAIRVDIYVAEHCPICAYSYEIADFIRENFPAVRLRVINIEAAQGSIPEAVFATPTYMLNDRIWSLGNPSPAQVREKLQNLLVDIGT